MMWGLPFSVEIDGKEQAIRNKCDYRVVLDVICALNDDELTMEEKIECALTIFYEDISAINDIETAIKEMFCIINGGEQEQETQDHKPQLMDWKHDFSQIAPPISRVLGYDVRTPDKFTHWFSFLGGYMEIGECFFQNIVGIREKLRSGKKLEKWEEKILKEHRKQVLLPRKLTAEEQEFLDSDW